MKKLLKPLLSLALSILMIGTTLPMEVQAKTKSGTNLRLEEIEGTVNLSNSQGKKLTAEADVKLYNGYKVSTGNASYAWISIDKDIIVKLDKSTSVAIKQTGKKLEVQLDKGKLLFDAKKPLEKDTLLNIRTSNTTTGIRGTVGIVERNIYNLEKDDSFEVVTVTTILEGEVEQQRLTSNSLGENQDTVTIGAMMQSRVNTSFIGDNTIGSETKLGETVATVEQISLVESIMSNGFVAKELKGNAELAEKLSKVENTDLTPKAIENIQKAADNILKKEEDESKKERFLESVKKVIEETGKLEGEAENYFPKYEPENENSSSNNGGGGWVPPKLSSIISFYDGEGLIFATQKVFLGDNVQRPSLSPMEQGEWKYLENGQFIKYEFGKTTNNDISLYWK